MVGTVSSVITYYPLAHLPLWYCAGAELQKEEIVPVEGYV
jgi:hypothetical protein